ncbi:MAG: hypothetical protein RIR62_3041 [Pseudomonadota bacterium]|jgi:hypothetical protein
MPTAAKLVGAVLFGLLGAGLALYLPAILPESMPYGALLPVSAAVAALCGWMIAGAAAGRGRSYAEGAATGARTAVTAAFAVLFVFSVEQMLALAFRRLYDGPVEAVIGIFEQMVKLAPLLIDAGFIALLVIGGMVAGALTEGAGRRWR